jgi:hypothetical protein
MSKGVFLVISQERQQQVIEPSRTALVVGSLFIGLVAGVFVATVVGLLEFVLVAVSP